MNGIWHHEVIVALRYFGAMLLAACAIALSSHGVRGPTRRLQLIALSTLACVLVVAGALNYPPWFFETGPVPFLQVDSIEIGLVFALPFVAATDAGRARAWLWPSLGAGIVVAIANAGGLTDVMTGTRGYGVGIEVGAGTIFSAPWYHQTLQSTLVLVASAVLLAILVIYSVQRDRRLTGASMASVALFVCTLVTRTLSW